MLELGMPSFYITINPADLLNPVVRFLSGADIDVDNLTADDIPSQHEQSVMIARNPFVGAKFFNLYLNAFFKCILGFDRTNRTYTEEGGVGMGGIE